MHSSCSFYGDQSCKHTNFFNKASVIFLQNSHFVSFCCLLLLRIIRHPCRNAIHFYSVLKNILLYHFLPFDYNNLLLIDGASVLFRNSKSITSSTKLCSLFADINTTEDKQTHTEWKTNNVSGPYDPLTEASRKNIQIDHKPLNLIVCYSSNFLFFPISLPIPIFLIYW